MRRINVSEGPSEERILITGLHTVCDIYCNVCQTVLGWKYVSLVPSYSPAGLAKFCIDLFSHTEPQISV